MDKLFVRLPEFPVLEYGWMEKSVTNHSGKVFPKLNKIIYAHRTIYKRMSSDHQTKPVKVSCKFDLG